MAVGNIHIDTTARDFQILSTIYYVKNYVTDRVC